MENEKQITTTQSGRTKPISAWGYVGYQILYSIPIIGFILLIVHAVSATNQNLRNYARSFFCVFLLGIILTVVITILFVVMMMAMPEFFQEFSQQFEQYMQEYMQTVQ